MYRNNENNAYIDAMNVNIEFIAPYKGTLHIKAGYCEIYLKKDDCVVITEEECLINMTADEKLYLKNVLGLKTLVYEDKIE